ncbi:PCYCGC motif-containing (lipo)protein [Desmospora profundinema]|uniref:Lipoprotein n=1 Tax=Desmospora profundinema TaxID=1571184 RepID=A0ABU1IJG3_9BACL|nr:PCYCGC motif-containing (lipo)protein [Desmospora profundinema]MDR6224677.1 hypothetical protein [Desmospora profundinema]
MKTIIRRLTVSAILVVVLAACSQQDTEFYYEGVAGKQFPDYVESSPVEHVKVAYAYAADHPEQLEYIPCYCGCGSIGHGSVKSCFLSSESDQDVSYDPHGAGCEICVQVVLDTMKGKQEGQSLQEIRQEIDRRYGERFVPTDTPEPPPDM